MSSPLPSPLYKYPFSHSLSSLVSIAFIPAFQCRRALSHFLLQNVLSKFSMEVKQLSMSDSANVGHLIVASEVTSLLISHPPPTPPVDSIVFQQSVMKFFECVDGILKRFNKEEISWAEVWFANHSMMRRKK